MAPRVLLVSHYFPPHIGGIENVVRGEAAALVKEGWEVTVLTTAVGAPPGVAPDPGGYTVIRLPTWNGFERRTGVPFPVPAPGRLWWTVARHVRAVDVVHCHDVLYLTTWSAAAAAAALRRPLVLTQHVQLVRHPSRIVEAVQRLVHITAARWVARTARRVAVLNTSTRDFMHQLGVSANRVVHVPNGVDTDLFHPATTEEKQYLRRELGLPQEAVLALFVGRFVPKKGYEKLLKADGSGCVLVLAGGSPPPQRSDRTDVVFAGDLAQDDVARLYRACDLFVLPSESEGFPLTVQEAMASGLPVVTSDDPGYEAYGLDRDHVALIEPTVREIRSVLHRLATDEELRQAMGRYSLEVATSRFSWPEHARRIGQLYNEAIAECGRCDGGKR